MNSLIKKPSGGILLLMIALAFLATACGSNESNASDELPTRIPDSTPLPHATHTPIAIAALPELAPVDWSQVEHFRSTMKPAFTGDIDEYANRQRYYIEATIEINPIVTIINGAQHVRYTNRTTDTLNEVVFRLVPNSPDFGWRMRVSNVKVAGQAVEPIYELMDSVMTLPLAQPLATGESVEMFMNFNLTAERGITNPHFTNDRDFFAAPLWYPALSVYEAGSGWWKDIITRYGDPGYTESGLFEIKLTHHESTHIIISGVTIDTQPAGNELVTEHIVSGPMRDMYLMASDVVGKVTDEIEGTTINVYYLPGGEQATDWGMEVAKNSLSIFNRVFGEFPYAEVDVVEIDLPGGVIGVEFPGVYTIDEAAWYNGSPQMEGVIAHEAGHQWWAMMVGNNQIAYPWIDESLASYSEFVYWREAYDDSEERANEVIQNDRNAYNFARSNGGDYPIGLSIVTFGENNGGFLLYTKAPVFHTELENLLGRDVYRQALQAYFAEMRYETATAYDMLRIFEEVSGQDLDAVFYEWVGDFEGLDPAAKAQVDNDNAN